MGRDVEINHGGKGEGVFNRFNGAAGDDIPATSRTLATFVIFAAMATAEKIN